MSISSSGYSVDQDRDAIDPGNEAAAGDGGGIMAVWSESRENKLESLVSATITNESQFSIPTAVVNTQGYVQTLDQSERGNGVSVTGESVGGDSLPLPGTVSILAGNTTQAQRSTEGAFQIAVGPPDSAETGESASGTTSYTFKYVPDSGFAFEEPDLQPGIEVLRIEYGTVSGAVTDYDGNPVSNDTVTGRLESTGEEVEFTTGPLGEYRFDAPGGETIQVIGEGLETDDTANITSLSVTTIDFQYSGLEITLQAPNGTPQPGAPVTFSRFSGETDSNGQVTFIEVPVLTNITVNIYEDAERAITSAGQGVLKQETVVLGVGLAGQVNFSGTPVASVGVSLIDEDGNAYTTKSLGDGTYSVGSPNAGVLRARFAATDRRYATTEVTFSADDGDTVSEDVSLERRENISTY